MSDNETGHSQAGPPRGSPSEKPAGVCHGSEPRVHGLLQAWLLLFLAEREDHGYELVRRIAGELPEEMLPAPAVIYRMLRRLESEGAVQSTLQSGGGGPARKVYALTEHGRTRLREWRGTAERRIALLRNFLGRVTRITGETT